MAKIQYCGTGRRKSSVARVRLVAGKGDIIVNKKPLDEYFGMELLKREVRRPLELVGAEGKYDVIATVNGGGTTGQSGALRHGISRALCQADPENRAVLKAAGFMTRDPRMKERSTDSRKPVVLLSSARDNIAVLFRSHILQPLKICALLKQTMTSSRNCMVLGAFA